MRKRTTRGANHGPYHPRARLKGNRSAFPVVALCFAVACHGEVADGPSRDWTLARDSITYRTLRDSPQLCSGCISLSLNATIGDTTGPGILTVDVLYATQDSVGNYWLGQRADAIKVYRPDGSFLRQVGRSGQGPMEFINPAPIHTDGEGHVHVLDNSNLRHTIVNAAFELESETRLPAAVVDAFPLNDGRQFVVNMQFNTASELGHPLHVIKGDEILRSFGMDSRPGKNPLDPIETRRELGADKQGIVYSAKRYDYTLDAWTSDGERIVGFERIGLNPDPILSGSWGPHNPPPNRLFSIRPFNDHLVWVLSWIRDEDWQARMEERIAPNGAVMLVPENEDLHSIYSSVIEMVDFARGEVIARSVQDKLPYAFIARDLAIENGFTEEGHPRAMVWRVTYSNPSRR